MSVRKIIPMVKKNRTSNTTSKVQAKLEELAELLKAMKETDREILSRLDSLEARIEALEASASSRKSEIAGYLNAARQYARINHTRAIEELIKALASLQ